jgi:PAS domain S-box-containing protein
VNYQSIVIIGPDSLGDGTSAELSRQVAAAGLQAVVTSEAQAVAGLRQATVQGEEPPVVLIGPEVLNPIFVAREIRSVWRAGHLIFVRRENQLEPLRRDLRRAPMIGSQWSIAELADKALPALISESVQATRRRLKLRTTLDRANVQLAAHKPVDSIDYRRLVLSEHYLRHFLEQAKDAIVSLDAKLQVLYWNASAERLFGVAAKRAFGLHVTELPFWSPMLNDTLGKIGSAENSLASEFICRLPTGEVALDIVFCAVHDETGGLIGTTLAIRDVSTRHQLIEAERKAHHETTRLLDSERLRLLSLFDQAPGFMAVMRGPDHVFEMANQTYYRLAGGRELIGKPARLAFPEIEGQGFFELLDEAYRSGKPFLGRAMPVFIQRDAGAAMEQLFVDFVYQPVIESDGTITGIFCQGNDVTAQKLAQDLLVQHQTQLEDLVSERTEALRQTEVALHRSQKLESLGKLTGGVAHDFNNILQVIAGSLDLLRTDFAGNAGAVKRLNTAVAAVDHGANLALQLLAFARSQPLQPVPTNLGRVLREIDNLLRRALGESVEIETIIGGGLWTAMVDRNRLENVILNLAINARDAMKGEGRLTLELGNAMLDDHYAETHSEVSPGQYVMLAVSDTGSGMSAEVMERAFEPFFTTKREGEGNGLGLSMAYGFVKQSGGHIKIYSEPGNGTTFKIYLPRAHQAEVLVPDLRISQAAGGTETILVVEDDIAVQATVVDTLTGLGYKVLKAKDGESGLTVLQSGISIDLLFTDVVMPGPVRSTELARQAKELLPNIEVLFTSGYTQNAIVHGGRLDPGVELISKPYRREDLARKIRHMLANKQQALRAQSTMDQANAAAGVSSTASPRRILVVEDNADSLEVLCELLALLGFAAQGVSSGEDALKALESSAFDILLTDMRLPGISGMELARKAASDNPALKVIFASGYAAVDSTEFKAFSLLKPYDLLQLQRVLSEVT